MSLLRPPRGEASISFSASDFGNFLKHPMVEGASRKAIKNKAFNFKPLEGVTIEEGGCEEGNIKRSTFVRFSGVWEADGELYVLRMGVEESDKTRVTMEAKSNTGKDDEIVALELRKFFNSLSLDLDGTVMRFASMNFFWHKSKTKTGAAERALKLDLKVVVNRFPPPNVSF